MFKMVRRVIRELGLRCQVRPKKRSRIKQQDQYVQDNLLKQIVDVDAPNQVWLSDSTELDGVNGEHKVRLNGVMDLYGRRILAYNLRTCLGSWICRYFSGVLVKKWRVITQCNHLPITTVATFPVNNLS